MAMRLFVLRASASGASTGGSTGSSLSGTRIDLCGCPCRLQLERHRPRPPREAHKLLTKFSDLLNSRTMSHSRF
jgi:hypothetical protein